MNICDPTIARFAPVILGLSLAAATMIGGLVIWGCICLVRHLFGPNEADTLTLWEVPPGTPPGAVFHLQPGVRLKWPPGSSYTALMLPKRCARCGDRRIRQVEPGSHILTMACDACGERWLP